MEEPNTHTYTITKRRGIDDLESIYAFYGNSQGNTTHTNSIDDYKNSKGWLSFGFKGADPNDQEAINRESERIKISNAKYIASLLKEGKFGEEYTMTIEMVYNPLFDGPYKPTEDGRK